MIPGKGVKVVRLHATERIGVAHQYSPAINIKAPAVLSGLKSWTDVCFRLFRDHLPSKRPYRAAHSKAALHRMQANACSFS
ncbi:MAG: hypothetical protein ACYDDO_00930 [Acidiferrobacterales bacterium]